MGLKPMGPGGTAMYIGLIGGTLLNPGGGRIGTGVPTGPEELFIYHELLMVDVVVVVQVVPDDRRALNPGGGKSILGCLFGLAGSEAPFP